MTLFKFCECEACKQKCNNAKLSLHQLLPANVCEKHGEYNHQCECQRIQMLREKENKFIKEQYHKDLTIGEKTHIVLHNVSGYTYLVDRRIDGCNRRTKQAK